MKKKKKKRKKEKEKEKERRKKKLKGPRTKGIRVEKRYSLEEKPQNPQE